MTHCVWCGHGGIFLGVDNNGLCRRCQVTVYPDITAKAELVLRCYKDIKATEKLRVKIPLVKSLLAAVGDLQKYEAKNIPTPEINIDLTGVLAESTDFSLVDIIINRPTNK
jgi:hypothetical protein